MNILFYLTIILVIISPFTELLRFDVRNDLSIHAPDLFVGIVLLYLLGYLIVKRKFSRKAFVHPIFLFVYACIVSLAVNSLGLKVDQLGIASLYLLRWIGYASIYSIIKEFSASQKGKVIFIFLVEGFIVTVLGYLQYFFYPALRNLIYLGWDEHLHRLFSVFLDPNFAGIYLVLYFLLISGMLYTGWKNFDKKKKIVIGYLLLLVLGAIVLTFSRTALVMLLAGTILFFLMIKRAQWILLLLLCTGVLLLFLSPQFHDENMNLFRTASSEARLSTDSDALHVIQKSPIFGVGFDAYRYAQIKYGYRNAATRYASHADAGVDNSFLFVFVTSGIIGFLAYLYLWYHFLRRSWQHFTQQRDGLSLMAICSIVAGLLGGLFINSLFYAPVMLWLWVLMAISHPSEP